MTKQGRFRKVSEFPMVLGVLYISGMYPSFCSADMESEMVCTQEYKSKLLQNQTSELMMVTFCLLIGVDMLRLFYEAIP